MNHSDNQINKKRNYDSYLEYEHTNKPNTSGLHSTSSNLVGTDIDKTSVLNEETLGVSYDDLSILEKDTLYTLYNKKSFEHPEYRLLKQCEQYDLDIISLYLDKNDNILYSSADDPGGNLRFMLPRKIDMRYLMHVHVMKK